jgi:hypothetical protein
MVPISAASSSNKERGIEMKGYMIRLALISLIVSSLPLFPVCTARSEEAKQAPGGFQWGGNIELGYRFSDIDGTNRHDTVNLQPGLKLFDLNFWGKNLEKNGLVDYFSLTGNGIGDAYPWGTLVVKKDKAYDFKATYREFKYIYNGGDESLLGDDHNFYQKRRIGTAALSLFPKDDVRVTLGYRYAGRTGEATVPFVFNGSPLQDLDEQLNEYFVSTDFHLGDWDFHVKQDFWTFRSRNQIEDQDPEVHANPYSTVNTYVSTVKAHTQLSERWDLDTGYIYAHSEGRADLVSSPTVPTTENGRSHFSSNIHIAELGLSHLLMTNLIAHLDYRFHVENKDAVSHTDEDIPRPDFNQVSHTGTFQLEYLPRDNVTLRAGYRLQYRDINGDVAVTDPNIKGGKESQDAEILSHGWIASADWKPWKVLSVFGEYQGANFDNPYTRISPDSENIAKVRIKYDTPLKNLTLKGTARWRRRENPDQDYSADVQDYTIAAIFQPALLSGLTFDGSFTYEKIKDKKNSFTFSSFSFERFVFESNAIIWTGGLTYEGIYKGLGARINGSYAKTYNENSQRYADGVFSLWYKNKCVTPIITLERTYLHDHVQRSDSFDANLLTFSLRKDF